MIVLSFIDSLLAVKYLGIKEAWILVFAERTLDNAIWHFSGKIFSHCAEISPVTRHQTAVRKKVDI